MKRISVASLVLMATLALGAGSAKAQPTGDYLKLNVALTLQQQALLATNKNGDGVLISTIAKSRLNNKAFLAFLGEMFDTNWPPGARLEFEIGMGMFVADKTGTNVLFYCQDGVSNASRYAYVNLEWWSQPGPFSSTYMTNTPGWYKFNSNWQGAIRIYYTNFSDVSVYTDLYGDGLNVEKTFSKWTSPTNGVSSWKETFTPVGIGSVGNVNAIITGKITARGKTTH